ncbi:tripartite tricarboxylate transporter substrate binding protein, partial [Verminephrobacter sp. Larva24]
MPPFITQALASAMLAMQTLALQPAQAQTFPAKPVRVVTPFPAGSGPEVALRLVADRLGKRWG